MLGIISEDSYVISMYFTGNSLSCFVSFIYVANIRVLNFVAWFVYIISNSYWLHEHIFVHFDC